MLVALMYLYFKSGGSFDILTWHKLPLREGAQTWLFFAFLAAFSVKVPMWPVHTWLPDAHVEAPTGGSVVLAAIMLKLGAYGFLRFSLPIVPDASREWAWFIIAMSLIAVIYIGLVALVQNDMKKLVAYSSVAHMGFVTLGFFIFSDLGVSGGLVQMISHGFISGTMPKFATLAVLFAMANCGLPGTSGFVGEWMVIIGTVKTSFWLAALAATTLVFGAAYTLWMVKRVYFGDVANDDVKVLADLDPRELVVLSMLAIAVLWVGVYPKPVTDVMNVSVGELLKHVAQPKLP
jgi:NADH-quinone oxidoreductase subunit M